MTKTCSYYFKPEKAGYLPKLCCLSCHEDADEFGYALCSAPDDDDSEVCCAVKIALEEQKKAASLAHSPTEETKSVG